MPARPTAQVRTGAVQTGAIKPAASQLIEEDEESGVMPLVIVCMVLAIGVLGIQFASSQKFFPNALPASKNPYERELSTGEFRPSIDSKLKTVPTTPQEIGG